MRRGLYGPHVYKRDYIGISFLVCHIALKISKSRPTQLNLDNKVNFFQKSTIFSNFSKNTFFLICQKRTIFINFKKAQLFLIFKKYYDWHYVQPKPRHTYNQFLKSQSKKGYAKICGL